MDLRIRPKSDYLQTANWKGLYALAEQWRSDLEFYRIEILFLKELIDKYFIWLIEDENINTVRKLTARLIRLDQDCTRINSGVNKHLKQMADRIENSLTHKDQIFRDEHVLLEDNLTDFVKEFVLLKKEIFKTTGSVIETEKLKRLLAK